MREQISLNLQSKVGPGHEKLWNYYIIIKIYSHTQRYKYIYKWCSLNLFI